MLSLGSASNLEVLRPVEVCSNRTNIRAAGSEALKTDRAPCFALIDVDSVDGRNARGDSSALRMLRLVLLPGSAAKTVRRYWGASGFGI